MSQRLGSEGSRQSVNLLGPPLILAIRYNIFHLSGTLLCSGVFPQSTQRCLQLAKGCSLIKEELALAVGTVQFNCLTLLERRRAVPVGLQSGDKRCRAGQGPICTSPLLATQQPRRGLLAVQPSHLTDPCRAHEPKTH